MRYIIIIYLLFTASSCYPQKNKKGKQPQAKVFNLEVFNSNFEIAIWLNEYERVATLTADTIMNNANSDEVDRLGKDWFCFKDATGLWHAIYGKYYLGEFDQVFHFIVDSNYSIRRSREIKDSSLVNPYARALRKAALRYRDLGDSSGIYFNRFVRKESDGEFRVYMLPVLQPNGNSVYGRSYIFFMDPQGTDIKEIIHTSKEPIITYNVNVPREIWVNNLKQGEPTVPSLFFAWYYKAYFKRIHIESFNMVSTLAKDHTGAYKWVHVKPDENLKKK